jgi:hypothetical protein
MKLWQIVLLCVVGGFLLIVLLRNLLFTNPDMRNDDSVLDGEPIGGRGWFGVTLGII